MQPLLLLKVCSGWNGSNRSVQNPGWSRWPSYRHNDIQSFDEAEAATIVASSSGGRLTRVYQHLGNLSGSDPAGSKIKSRGGI